MALLFDLAVMGLAFLPAGPGGTPSDLDPAGLSATFRTTEVDDGTGEPAYAEGRILLRLHGLLAGGARGIARRCYAATRIPVL